MVSGPQDGDLCSAGWGSSQHPQELPGLAGSAEGLPGDTEGLPGGFLQMQRNGKLFTVVTCSSINFSQIFCAFV